MVYLTQYIEERKPEGEVKVISRTRQELYEETGISIKTLNRTIQKMKAEGAVGIYKGKISLTREQYQRMKGYLKQNP